MVVYSITEGFVRDFKGSNARGSNDYSIVGFNRITTAIVYSVSKGFIGGGIIALSYKGSEGIL